MKFSELLWKILGVRDEGLGFVLHELGRLFVVFG